MPGPIQSIDIDVNLESETDRNIPIPDTLHIVDGTVERSYGGTGSTLKMDVIFTDLFTESEKQRLQTLIEADSIADLDDDVIQARTKDGQVVTAGLDTENIPDRVDSIQDLIIEEPENISLEQMIPEKYFEDDLFPSPSEAGGIEEWWNKWGVYNVKHETNLFDSTPSAEDIRNLNTVKKKYIASEATRKPFSTYEGSQGGPGEIAAWILNSVSKDDFESPLRYYVGPEELETQTSDLSEASILQPEDRRELDITISVDINISFPIQNVIDSGSNGASDEFSFTRRIFTGTLTKITQKHDRVVTLEAIDRRLQLNRNSVFLEVNNRDALSTLVNVFDMLEWSIRGRGTEEQSTVPNPDVIITDEARQKLSNTQISDSWGVRSHTSIYEFVQDIMSKTGLTIYIDNRNVIRIREQSNSPIPRIHGEKLVEANTLWSDLVRTAQPPPIVEWTSADEEDRTDTIGETSYDSTGLGVYSAVSRDRLEETVAGSDTDVDIRDVSRNISDNSVITRDAVKEAVDFENATQAAMRSSGTLGFVGDPRFEPYDLVDVSESTIEAFTPISSGTYIVKNVTHKFGSRQGYITEVELATDADDLSQAFADAARDRQPQKEDKFTQEDVDTPGALDIIPFTDTVQNTGEGVWNFIRRGTESGDNTPWVPFI